MINSTQRLGWVALIVALTPGAVWGQTRADSFESLQPTLQPGQPVVVTDQTGRQVKGTVEKVTPSSITVTGRTFTESSVREIRLQDPLWNGALIGAAVGTGLALWDYAIDPSEPGNTYIFTVSIAAGTAIGAGIDALRGGRVI